MRYEAKNLIADHDFYCTQCGKRGLPVCRTANRLRKPGHLKKLYCMNCSKETNHAECIPFSVYTTDIFAEEFASGNFTETGQRKLELSEWLSENRKTGNNRYVVDNAGGGMPYHTIYIL